MSQIFFFRYITSDQEREEFGTFNDGSNLEVEGYYSYLFNGNQVKRYYKAGKHGSQFSNSPTNLYLIPDTNKEGDIQPQLTGGIYVPPAISSGAIATLTGGGLG